MAILNMTDSQLALLLLRRMEATDFIGLDPSAVKYDPDLLSFLNKFKNNKYIYKIIHYLVYKTLFYLGHRIHPVLNPDRVIYTKGLALTLSGILNLIKNNNEFESLYNSLKKVLHLLQSKKLLKSNLFAHDVNYYIGNTFISTSTPNLITTAFVANAYWDLSAHKYFRQYNDFFIELIDDMVNTFPFRIYKSGGCFMYTPITEYYVHNANLLMAELLSKYISLKPNHHYFDLLTRALDYSLPDFSDGRKFPYAGSPTPNPSVDNYHTGYVLRSLLEINACTPEIANSRNIMEVIKNGLIFYMDTFIKNGFVLQGNYNMIETHSLAEAIIIFKKFSRWLNETQKSIFQTGIRNTMKVLWNPTKNYFNNNIKAIPYVGNISDNSEMIRWSNAWMFYALSL